MCDLRLIVTIAFLVVLSFMIPDSVLAESDPLTVEVTPPQSVTATGVVNGMGDWNSSDVYPAGTVIALTVTSAAGYRFAAWAGAAAVSHEDDMLLLVTIGYEKQVVTAHF